jgi:hypothetical protein
LTEAKRSLFIGDKNIHSSVRRLHKGYNQKGSGEKKNPGLIIKGLGAKTN